MHVGDGAHDVPQINIMENGASRGRPLQFLFQSEKCFLFLQTSGIAG